MSNTAKIAINNVRKLSVVKYFEQLQNEYITAKIRSQIYPSYGDRQYWKKVMQRKKDKITDIAERNKIPSIFSDQELLKKVDSKIKGPQGFPIFNYKDQNEYDKLYLSDLNNYYHKGSEVRVNPTETTFCFGIIENFDQSKNLVLVKIDDKDLIFHIDVVTRIL